MHLCVDSKNLGFKVRFFSLFKDRVHFRDKLLKCLIWKKHVECFRFLWCILCLWFYLLSVDVLCILPFKWMFNYTEPQIYLKYEEHLFPNFFCFMLRGVLWIAFLQCLKKVQVQVLCNVTFTIQFHLPKWHKLLSRFESDKKNLYPYNLAQFLSVRTLLPVWSDKTQLWFKKTL